MDEEELESLDKDGKEAWANFRDGGKLKSPAARELLKIVYKISIHPDFKGNPMEIFKQGKSAAKAQARALGVALMTEEQKLKKKARKRQRRMERGQEEPPKEPTQPSGTPMNSSESTQTTSTDQTSIEAALKVNSKTPSTNGDHTEINQNASQSNRNEKSNIGESPMAQHYLKLGKKVVMFRFTRRIKDEEDEQGRSWQELATHQLRVCERKDQISGLAQLARHYVIVLLKKEEDQKHWLGKPFTVRMGTKNERGTFQSLCAAIKHVWWKIPGALIGLDNEWQEVIEKAWKAKVKHLGRPNFGSIDSDEIIFCVDKPMSEERLPVIILCGVVYKATPWDQRRCQLCARPHSSLDCITIRWIIGGQCSEHDQEMEDISSEDE